MAAVMTGGRVPDTHLGPTDLSHADWLACTEDLPRFEEFLKVCDPNSGVQWLVVYGDFSWEQPHPADMDRHDVERRRFGFTVTGYFVHAGEICQFCRVAR